MILFLFACATDGAGPDTNAGDTAPEGPAALTDASNYSYTMALDIGQSPIAIDADDTLDWSGLTEDLRGNAVDPAADVLGIDLVWLRDLTPDEAEAAFVAGTITQASVGLYATGLVTPGTTHKRFSEFDLYGTPFAPEEYFLNEGGSWLLRFSTMDNHEAMVHFLVPQADAPTTVSIDNDSATLDFAPDLQSLTPVRLGASREVDWTALTRDGRGVALDPLNIQELWIARYDGLDVPTLQSRFFELETLAADTWTLNVYGEDGASLGDALDDAGQAFPGVTADATWLLALRCTICASPAPLYLTVLAPD